MTPLSQLGEQAVLEHLLRHAPAAPPQLLLGPGDDCAVVQRCAEWDTLLKADALVEGVHFTPDTDPRLIGRKALARAVSDVAAMGGLPEHALITLMVHPSRSVELLEGIYCGMSALAEEFGISLAGGETSSLPQDGLALSVALTGRVERGQAILRSGGRPGDILCVTGALGGSFASGRHLRFTPRVQWARYLAASPLRPHAMMDLSDGLAADLPRLAAASGCGFELEESRLPCHAGCTPEQALRDGEDYELLLALSPEQAAQLPLHPELPLTPIGRLTADKAPELTGGWQHFSSIPSQA